MGVENFFNELTTYVTDRILEEHLKPDLNRNLAVYIACAYGSAILYETQPTKVLPRIQFPTFSAEESVIRAPILIPEYVLTPLSTMLQALNTPETQEAFNIMKWLFQQEAFQFCLERPVKYSPSGKMPYPKEKHPQVFINGSQSRIKLKSEDELLTTAESMEKLRRLHNTFESSLNEINDIEPRARFKINDPNAFINNLSKSAEEFKAWKAQAADRLKNKNFSLLNEVFELPIVPASTLITPVSDEERQKYYDACDRYDKLANCEAVAALPGDIKVERPIIQGNVILSRILKKIRTARLCEDKNGQKKGQKRPRDDQVVKPRKISKS